MHFFAAIFMLRDESFLDAMPEGHKPDFVDKTGVAPTKLALLKSMIADRFPVRNEHFCDYCFVLCLLLLTL